VSDGDIFSEVHAVFLFHAVQDATVLHVGVRTDADLMHITAQDCVHPDAGVLAEHHVTDDLRRYIDETGCRDGGSFSFERANHFWRLAFSRIWRSSSPFTRLRTLQTIFNFFISHSRDWPKCQNAKCWTSIPPAFATTARTAPSRFRVR